MLRLTPLERHEAPAAALEWYERDEAAWGAVLNTADKNVNEELFEGCGRTTRTSRASS